MINVEYCIINNLWFKLINSNLVNGFYLGEWLVLPNQNLLKTSGTKVYIEPKLMEVLLCLSSSQPEVLSADLLIDTCWPNQYFSDNPVHKCIARLRKALNDDAKNPKYIKTFPKKGYAIISEISVVKSLKDAVEHFWQDGPPYLGFNSYQENHREIFFGRHKAISEINQLLNKIDSNHQILMIMGAHSVGKTSLIDSQIIPALQTNAKSIDKGSSSILKFTISKDSLINETNLLTKKIKLHIHSVLDHKKNDNEEDKINHVVFIDQLERIVINRSTAQVDSFLVVLKELIDTKNFKIITALNHEYFAELMKLETFQHIKKNAIVYDLLPPDQEELRDIITKPVEASGLKFEYDEVKFQSLDACIINDVTNLNLALPVLSHTMKELCVNKNENNELTYKCYQQIGGLTGFVANQFDEIYNSFDRKEKVFFKDQLHRLIKIDPKNPKKLYCAEVDIQNIQGHSKNPLLNKLMAANLIAAKIIDGRTYIAIAHEALLDQCDVFKLWIAENKIKLSGVAEIQLLHSHWIKHKKTNHHLTNNIDLLNKAQTFNLNKSERDFVHRSLKKYNQTNRKKIAAIVSLVCMLVITIILLIKINMNNKEISFTKNKAEALNVFLMQDLKEKLKPIGRLDLLEMISQQIIQYYSFQPQKNFNESSYGHLIDALNTMGEVKIRSGELAQAMTLLTDSENYIQKSLLINERNIQTIFQSSQNSYWKGYLHYLKKEWEDTEGFWTDYLNLTIQLEVLEPNNLNWQLEHSYALNNLGTLFLNLKQNDVAQKYLIESKNIKTNLVRKDPRNSQYVAELADTISWLANLSTGENKLVNANDYHHESLALSKQLIDIDSNNSNWDYRLALAYYRLGISDYDLGNLISTRSNIEASIQIMDELLLVDDRNHKWIRTLINNHIILAKLNRHKGLYDQSLWHVEQGKFYYHKYSSQNKKLIREANQLLKLNTVSSLILNDLGQNKSALTQYQKAFEHFQKNSNSDQIPVFITAYHFYILSVLTHSDQEISLSQSYLEKARKVLLEEINEGTNNKEIMALYLMISNENKSEGLLAQIKLRLKTMNFKNPDLFKQEKSNDRDDG